MQAHDLRHVTAMLHQGANANALVRSAHQHGTSILVTLLEEPQEHADILQALLQAGANPNARYYLEDEERDGSNALFLTYIQHYWRSMKLLLDHGADPNRGWYIDHPYILPLEWTAGDNSLQAATLLLDHGAKINATGNGDTALMTTAGCGNETMVQLLLRRGANPNIVSNHIEQTTALKIAREEGHENITRLLPRAGAKP